MVVSIYKPESTVRIQIDDTKEVEEFAVEQVDIKEN